MGYNHLNFGRIDTSFMPALIQVRNSSFFEATYKMTLMDFLVSIHINNQSTLYKVNSVVNLTPSNEYVLLVAYSCNPTACKLLYCK
jgi:hypothetical protein